jgi:hypothetical protein
MVSQFFSMLTPECWLEDSDFWFLFPTDCSQQIFFYTMRQALLQQQTLLRILISAPLQGRFADRNYACYHGNHDILIA